MITKQEFNTITEAFSFYDEYLNSHEYTYTYHNKHTNKHESFDIYLEKIILSIYVGLNTIILIH